MKLKYYLRGLGMGILITAMITGVSNKNRTTMTEDQIRAEARKLGMVEGSTVLSESEDTIEGDGAGKEESEQNEDASSEEEEEESQSTSEVISLNSTSQNAVNYRADESEKNEVQTISNNTATEGEEAAEVEEKTEIDVLDEVENEEDAEVTDADNTESKPTVQTTAGEATIVVNQGESSMIISTRLEAAGVVASALDYDKFLCAHGYDKILHVGRHTIRIGASYEEIARILMSKP